MHVRDLQISVLISEREAVEEERIRQQTDLELAGLKQNFAQHEVFHEDDK
jgi:hypothetical protein